MKIFQSRIDPLTGETFIPKRKNQRFANRPNQIKFNNKKKSIESTNDQSTISNPIKKANTINSRAQPFDFNPFGISGKPISKTEAIDYFYLGVISCVVITMVIVFLQKAKM